MADEKEGYSSVSCKEKHTDIKETLNNHECRLDKIEQRAERVDTKIEGLCDQIKNLVSTLKWGFGIILTITLFVLGYLLQIN